MKNFWIGFGAGILALIVVFFLYFFFGFFNISAAAPHPLLTGILDELKDMSVNSQSRNIKINLTKADSNLNDGATCHGAPGFERKKYTNYMDPIPPDLSSIETMEDLTDARLFWIIKNGIRMTGMAAFGKIESDDEIKNKILFIKEMQNLKKEDIEILIK